jgi:TP901 family phage tail tape measure protein
MSSKLSLIVNFLGVDKMSGALRSIIGLGRKGGRSLGELRGESRKLATQLREVRKQIAEGADNIEELAQKERELKDAMADVNEEMRKRARENAIEGKRREDRAEAEALQQKGMDNIRQGATLAAPLILAAREAGNFSSGMVDIQQKANLTNAQLVRVKDTILQAAAASGRMPADLLASVEMLSGLGMSVQESAKLAEPMGRFMTAFKVEGADAAAAIHAGLRTMNLSLADTGKLLDMMAEGGNIGAFEISDMAAAFPTLTAQMKALGETGKKGTAELVAMLEIVRINSGTSEKAMTQSSDLLNKLTAPTTMKAFEKAGIDAMSAIKNGAKQGISPLETMIGLTKKATGGDLMRLQEFFSEKDSSAAMRALILNYDEFAAAKKRVAAASGTTDAAFNMRMEGDSAANWVALAGSVSRLGIVLGTTLVPMMNDGVNMVISMATAVSDWASANPEAAKTIMQIVAGLALFKIGVGAAQFAIGAIMKPIANLNAFVAKIGGWKHVLGMAKVGFDMLRVAVLFLAKGVMRAGIMLLANPVVLAITALVVVIGGAAYLIYTHWDTIKQAFWQGIALVQQAWETLKGYLTTGFAWFVTLPARLAQIGAAIIQGLIRGLLSRASAVWQTLKRIVLNGIDGVKKFLGIASPSRVFMTIGEQTGQGMAIGLDRQGGRVAGAASRLAKGALAAGALAITPGVNASPASGAGRAAAGTGATYNFTLNIHKNDGEGDEEFAQRIMRKLKRMMHDDAQRSYEDRA